MAQLQTSALLHSSNVMPHHHNYTFCVLLAEVKEEAVNLVVARVAFAEHLKQVRLSLSLALHSL